MGSERWIVSGAQPIDQASEKACAEEQNAESKETEMTVERMVGEFRREASRSEVKE